MSFCRILSTLCSQVVFHNIPHFGKRAGQKVQRKIAVAVQKVKTPLLFVPLLKSAKKIVNNHTSGELSDSLCLNNRTG
jgi:hypothetical protein